MSPPTVWAVDWADLIPLGGKPVERLRRRLFYSWASAYEFARYVAWKGQEGRR